ncbi:hypothetical protein MLD38_021041 [Melastoma candidum]|uniref:Uncharacterized protein n=1 Tax=Melastoma candidum TaxID=119954 RepID=A0ACB9QG40_9MYRT|nr:hypothetical protein MLD38_021041 [Melastoma candidum]
MEKMIRFTENGGLVITLTVFLLVYAQTFPASAAVKRNFFHGLNREDMVEMAGYGEEKLSMVLVTSYARVIRVIIAYSMHGQFQIHAIVDLQGKCCVRLLRTPRSLPCRPASHRKHEPIRLSSVRDRT